MSTIDRSELQRRHDLRLRVMAPADPARLRELPFLAALSAATRERTLERVAAHSQVFPVESGEIVLRQGEYSDSAFVVLDGVMELFVEPSPARGRPEPAAPTVSPAAATALEAGELFGDLSALSRYPATATVRARTAGKVLQIQLSGLRLLMAASPELRKAIESRYRERTLARYVRGVALFSGLADSEIDLLKEQAELRSFAPGSSIAREGEPIDGFSLLRGGFLKVSTRAGTSELALTYLRDGDYCGAAVLSPDAKWPFTLEALDHTELITFAPEVMRAIAQAHPAVAAQLEAEHAQRVALKASISGNPVASEHLQMAMETGLIHGQSVLLIDLSTCTRCDECVRGCADTHGGLPLMIREGQKYRNWLVPMACYQCTDPVCMLDCPTGAITREQGSLVVTIDEPTCIGCGNCAERCPWDNIVIVEPGDPGAGKRTAAVASKCDLCEAHGGGPACVRSCPHGSAQRISFKDMKQVASTLGTGNVRRFSGLRQVLRPTNPRLLMTTAAAAFALLAAQLIHARLWPWNPSRGLGLVFGILATTSFAGEMLYAARRRRARRSPPATLWLQAHIHLGLLGMAAVLAHSGLRWPAGTFGWVLLSLATWTTATGIAGRLLQGSLAAALGMGLRIETVYERIPELVRELRAEADGLVAGASDVLKNFYRSEIRDSLSGVTPAWSYLADVRAGHEAALAPLRRMIQFVEPTEKSTVRDLIVILTDKMQLDAQYTLQRVLRQWPWLHVPAACLLTSLILAHILAWFWY